MSKEILKLVDVAVGYESQSIVNGIQATVNESELITVLGKNGAGKSTLLNTLMGFQKALKGTIHLHQIPIEDYSAKALAQEIAIVLPRLSYVPAIKIKELVGMGRLPYRQSWQKYSQQDEQRIEEVLSLVGMSAFTNDYATKISEGQLQLVMIARALCQETAMIILDEPTSNLDIENQYRIFNLLADLTKKTKKSLVVATHELNLALEKSDKVWWTENGNLSENIPEQLAFDQQIYRKLAGNYMAFDEDAQRFVAHQKTANPIRVIGNNELSYWVRNAVIRLGFSLSVDAGPVITIENNQILMKHHQFATISDLVNYIAKEK